MRKKSFKKKALRRVMSSFMALSMAMMSVSFTTLADYVIKVQAADGNDSEETTDDTIQYSGEYVVGNSVYNYDVKKNDVVTITKWSGTDTEIEIPSMIDERYVTELADEAFTGCSELVSVKIPYSVVRIGAGTFGYCGSLKTVEFSESVKIIGDRAFNECVSLADIQLPESLTEIGRYAFWNCQSIENIYISANVNSIGYSAFTYCKNLVEIDVNEENPYFHSVNGVLYNKNCTELISWPEANVNFVLEEGLTHIGAAAFYENTNIENIKLPSTVTHIGEYAFHQCGNLKTMEFSSSLKEIGAWAFRGCILLENVQFPYGLEKIGNNAFANCDGIVVLELPDTLTELGESAFTSSGNISELKLSSGLQVISKAAFTHCDSLTSVEIPAGVTQIGDIAFQNCERLKKVIVSETVTSIGKNAFGIMSKPETGPYNVYGFTIVALPGSAAEQYALEKGHNFADITLGIPDDIVKYSGEYKEEGVTLVYDVMNDDTVVITGGECTAENLIIPSSIDDKPVTVVCDFALKGNSSIVNLEISEGIYKVGISAFENCDNLVQVKVPSTVSDLGWYAFADCDKLMAIDVDEYNLYYCTVEGVLYDAGLYKLIQCPAGLETVNIPECVITIYKGAFMGCRKIEEIALPDGIQYVNTRAFYNCSSLRGVTLPEGMTQISGYTFYGCSSLEQITIPSGVTIMQDGVFWNCESLKSIELPEGLKEIDSHLFDGCKSLTEITIPKNIECIKAYAFHNCENLKTITVPKEVTQIEKRAFGFINEVKNEDFVLLGYEDSEAERYAVESSVDFKKYIILTSDYGIELEFLEDMVEEEVKLDAKELGDEDEEYKDIVFDGKIDEENTKPEDVRFKAFGIAMLNALNEKVQPLGNVTVRIPCPIDFNGAECKIYYVDDNGRFFNMHATYKDGFIVFETNHFSTYMVTETLLIEDAPVEIVYGDANDDGTVNSKDAVMLKKHLAGYKDLGINTDACDVNCDGEVNSKDTVLILKKLAGYDVEFGK